MANVSLDINGFANAVVVKMATNRNCQHVLFKNKKRHYQMQNCIHLSIQISCFISIDRKN